MQAGAFVIHKLQLFKRICPSKGGNGSVPFIIELLQDKIRSLVKVSYSKTFEELWEIIKKLEEDHPTKTRPVTDGCNHRKCFSCVKVGHFKDK